MKTIWSAALVAALGALSGSVYVGGRAISDKISAQTAQISALSSKTELLLEDLRGNARPEAGHLHTDVRVSAIHSQMDQVTDPVVVVGDSITELALLPAAICGRPVINAGIGGLAISNYLPLVDAIFGNKRVPLIVVALGTNDSQKAYRDAAPIAKRYTALTAALTAKTDSFVYAGIPPIEKAPLSDMYFSTALADQNDSDIRKLADARSIAFIDFRAKMSGEKLTTDGIHLTADSYKPWLTAMVGTIQQKLGCNVGSK
ncbi:SGNH/GDSL hydrolase family protein [Tardiphaga sp. 813_E8_N1_3]|uniref:SGNH/GDSL hydrolase family protein n=1 Tax=Tardiphaga sp. 813_E8_N1_3 TaxID=3240760 RepID=UPI003F1EB73A